MIHLNAIDLNEIADSMLIQHYGGMGVPPARKTDTSGAASLPRAEPAVGDERAKQVLLEPFFIKRPRPYSPALLAHSASARERHNHRDRHDLPNEIKVKARDSLGAPASWGGTHWRKAGTA